MRTLSVLACGLAFVVPAAHSLERAARPIEWVDVHVHAVVNQRAPDFPGALAAALAAMNASRTRQIVLMPPPQVHAGAFDYQDFVSAAKAHGSHPLGLMKSTDGGRSWQQLGLSGESDFHVMAAGYGSNAIYVVNAEPNSRMRATGLHFTLDEGKSWKRSASAGLSGQIASLAAHPTAPAIVAIGTSSGLYASRDHGTTFKRIAHSGVATAVTFDLGGKHLYFATDAADRLHRVTLEGGQADAVLLPPLERDFVLYIAQNPGDKGELAIATRRRDVYLSRDAGKTWQQIARQGEAVHLAASQRAPRRSSR